MYFRIIVAFLLLTITGCVAPRPPQEPDLKPYGITYSLRHLRAPRPNRAHILQADLSKRKAVPVVVVAPDPDGEGPAEAVLTPPLELVKDRPALAFINANSWGGVPDASGKTDSVHREGKAVMIGGLAMAGGMIRSPPDPGYVSVRFPPRDPPVIEEKSHSSIAVEGVAGFQQIVRAGAVLPKPGGPLAPRTAVGVDQKGDKLWLVVVDGRQDGFSEGMTFEELAVLMKDLGCHDAANLDGGGSSIMGVRSRDGRMRIVNSPSDRLLTTVRIRPLPNVLTLEPAAGKDGR